MILREKNISLKVLAFVFFALLLSVGLHHIPVYCADLTLPTGGRVLVELITSYASYHNTLSLVSPNATVVLTGCDIEGTDAPDLKLLSEKTSQHGCRVELDADPNIPGIQPFNAGDTLEFSLCAQADADPVTCEYNWSSNPLENSDGKEHVSTTELYTGDPDIGGRVFMLKWEDQDNLGDEDFDDLIVIVRIVQDTDEDGLWDDWEKFGIDTDGNGAPDFTLPGADLSHKDLYIEIDYMDCNTAGGDCAAGDTHSHRPKQDAINEVIQAFQNAPVANPDGIDGVTLHVDIDDAIPHNTTLNLGCFSGSRNFDTIKNDPAFFGTNNPRRFAYHYVIFGHQQTTTTTSSGCGEVNGNDFIVTLGAWNYSCQGGVNAGASCSPWLGNADCLPGGTCQAEGDIDGDGDDDHDVGSDRQQAGTLMHELGHNLDLRHGGGECINYKPNYLSVMNYRFQFSGILPTNRLDYSGDDLNDLDENNLDETLGIGDGADDTRYNCPNGNVRTGAGMGAIDWNCDNDGGSDTSVTVNINGDCDDTVVVNCGGCNTGEGPEFGVLTGYNDWDNLKYDFQNSGNFQDGRHVDIDIPEMNFQTYLMTINNPPVANAGMDQTLECTSFDGASVTLNGSGSYDLDDDELTFVWTGPFSPPLTDEVIDTVLFCGTYSILLIVDDNKGGSDSDVVIVTVQDTTPPALIVPPDVIAECTGYEGQAVDIGLASATDICCADTEINNDAPALFYLGDTMVTWTATDCNGNSSTAVQMVTVQDTTPPELIVPPDVTVECTGYEGQAVDIGLASATDICCADTEINNDAPALFYLGETMVTWTATDCNGNSSTAVQIVTVQDTIPPELSISASPSILWPPNHRMVDIDISIEVSDICDIDPTVVLESVISSDPDDARGIGDGHTKNDIQNVEPGTEDHSISLRSERRARGRTGRSYTITYTATDDSGNSTSSDSVVKVPHRAPRR